MSDFVNTVDILGDDALVDSIITRDIEDIRDDLCGRIGVNAFYSCTSLTTAEFLVCSRIEASAFYGCKQLSAVSFPVCTAISSGAFRLCSALVTVSIPECGWIYSNAFYGCSGLQAVRLPVCKSIGSGAFSGCSNLSALHLGTPSVCNLNHSNAFSKTLIASGTGYVYVPASLVDSYKVDSKWSFFANQIVAMEE